MKQIPLTRGMVALVDDEDYERLSRYEWHAHVSNRTFYARRRDGHAGPAFYMHKEILPGVRVDHRDGNGLNNCRENLRPATQAQNVCNSRKQERPTSSKFKGVHFYARYENWMAYIHANGKKRHLGYFLTEAKAAAAYNFAALHHFGDFAKLNGVEHVGS